MLKDIKKALPRDRNRRLAVLIIALLALPITVVLVQRVVRYFTGAASATVYFEPASADLPPDQTLRLMVNSGSTRVGFARVEVNFDRSKVRLTSEISTTGMLTMNNADVSNTGNLPPDACTGTQKCIIKTPMNAANNTGKIVLVLAKDPRDSQNAPSGTFELARFTFRDYTTSQVSTNVTIPSNQLVDTNAQQFNVSVSSATLNLHGGGLSPTPPITGIISNLQVFDSANAANWSIQQNLQNNDLRFGDRAYRFTSVANLTGNDWIRTAVDSKYSLLNPLASFVVTQNAVIYVAHDDRIGTKPSWLSSWSDTGMNLTDTDGSSGNFSIFSKSFSSGQTVNLGPNANSVVERSTLYTVIATGTGAVSITPTQGPTVTPGGCSSTPGDVNNDGIVNVLDILEVVEVYFSSPPSNPCADLNGDNEVNVLDILEVVGYYP
jgi:hypothetical protein